MPLGERLCRRCGAGIVSYNRVPLCANHDARVISMRAAACGENVVVAKTIAALSCVAVLPTGKGAFDEWGTS